MRHRHKHIWLSASSPLHVEASFVCEVKADMMLVSIHMINLVVFAVYT